MSVEPGKTYTGTIEPGARMITSIKKGTLGFQITLSCRDGEIDHTIWITSSTRERVEKTFFEVFGVNRSQLQNPDFIEKELAKFIAGKEVEFTTIEQEHNGNYKTVVQWLNPPSVNANGDAVGMAAEFFGGKPSRKPKDSSSVSGGPITDDDVPF